jgi:hypothetical protein
MSRPRPIVAFLVVVLLGACAGPAPTQAPASRAPVPTAAATPSAAASPSAAVTPTAAPTAPSTPTTAPTPTEPPTPTAEPTAAAVTIASADGAFTVTVPPGAGIDPATITIEAVPATETPQEVTVAGDRILPGSAYRLGPDDANFTMPVTVTLRRARADLGLDASAPLPEIALATRSSEGVWEPLADPLVTEEEGVILISGTTTHFSDVYALRDFLVWLFCGSVIHSPFAIYPSFIEALIGFLRHRALENLYVRVILAEGDGDFVHADDVPLNHSPVRIPIGITRYGEKDIIGLQLVDAEGNVVAELTADLIGLNVRTFEVTADEGPVAGFGACHMYRPLSVDLGPAEEVPATTSNGGGRFTATISDDGTEITYEVSYQNLTGPVTAAHIHFGPPGVAGPIIIPLAIGSSPFSGTFNGTDFVAPADPTAPQTWPAVLNAIRAGVTYANVHTDAFPGGEIRGQLLFRPSD